MRRKFISRFNRPAREAGFQDYRASKSIKHDRKIRRWTRAGVIGALVYTLLTLGIFAGGVYSVYTTRVQFELTQRPWMEADIGFVSPLTFDNAGGHIDVRITMKNSGHSPANNVLRVGGFGLPKTMDELLSKEKEICTQASGSDLGVTQPGFIIFPNEQSSSTTRFLIPQSDIDSFRAATRGREIILHFFLCITYNFTFASSQRHETSYIYEFDKATDPNGGFVQVNPDEGVIQAGNLIMQTNPRFPGHAN